MSNLDIEILEKKEWDLLRREPYQRFPDYNKRIASILKKVEIGCDAIRNLSVNDEDYYVRLSSSSHMVAKLALESLMMSYSAGVIVLELSTRFKFIVNTWGCYSKYHRNYHKSEQCQGDPNSHLELSSDEYWEALQLICFSILFAQPEHLPTIIGILAYENDEQDALLDKLVSPWLPDRKISTVYLRQLPYRKLDKVFAADEKDRPALMSKYMDDWYGASRREPYHDRHKSSFFPGYWSLEAAAVTVILRIDDQSYRDKPYYPKDLVDYARSQYVSLDQNGDIEGGSDSRLRCIAGEICPQSGDWYSPANNMQLRYFEQGEILPEIPNNSWGETIWYLEVTNKK